MNASKFDAWMKKIWTTETEEILCSECLDLLPEVVEVDVLGEPVQASYKQVKHHLHQCQVCREEYELLRDLTRLDSESNQDADAR